MMRRIAIFLAGVVLLAPANAFAQSGNDVEPLAIIDTAIPFAAGAVERQLELRRPYGWPTYQQGFIGGLHFRFDPDGSARFSPDPRLQRDAFEVECEAVTRSCIAVRDGIEISRNQSGAINIGLSNPSDVDAIYLGAGRFELAGVSGGWRRIDYPFTPAGIQKILNSDQIALTRDGKLMAQASLTGIEIVISYLDWVQQGQQKNVLPPSWNLAHGERGQQDQPVKTASIGWNADSLPLDLPKLVSSLIPFDGNEGNDLDDFENGIKVAPENQTPGISSPAITIAKAGTVDLMGLSDAQITNLGVESFDYTQTGGANIPPGKILLDQELVVMLIKALLKKQLAADIVVQPGMMVSSVSTPK